MSFAWLYHGSSLVCYSIKLRGRTLKSRSSAVPGNYEQSSVVTCAILTLEVTNDNFHGVHRLELYIVAFKKNHCIANTGRKNINKIPLCC